ncbi:hypothetical protein M0805_008586 [Coniferiporia weirii]|nr:hypothetical protein M0805_008586 [Coniferiporia weirii]
MSDAVAPAIIKRTKTRTTRIRALSPTNESAEGSEASPSTLAAKLKRRHKERTKPKARLSFGGDDEEGDGEVFQVKKSGLSRRLKLSPSSVSLPSNLDQASITPQFSGIVYSKEYLSELKASTLSAPSNPPPEDSHDAVMELDESELSGAVIMDQEMTTETISEIPSESSVLAAKQKRDRLRQTKPPATQGGDDFISLSVTRREDNYQGPHSESRLMREDDVLGEGDDEFAEYTAAQERIALGKKAKKKEAVNRRSAMQELINDAEEEDEETIEWEREQLRRGARQGSEVPETKVKQEYKPTPIPNPTPLPTLDAAISRLGQSLAQLTVSHTSNTKSMSGLSDERSVLESKEKEMRSMVEKAERKRSWFSSFREWVETVATFLDEKYPLLEKLEEEHVSLLTERRDMVSKRRTQDDEDDLTLFLGALSAAAAEEPEELDELGRVVPRQNPEVARRERRKYRSLRHVRHKTSDEEEGYSTDSSLSPSDETDYQAALADLRTKASNILQDVQSDEFRDPRKGVARWFGGWRDKYSDTYTGAFGGLGMISAWEFWVRLELLGWDPVAQPRTLDTFAWFSALYDYSRPRTRDNEDEDDMEPELGPDGDLVSAMISTAVVPRLCKVIRGGAFDPYSAKHVRILIDLAEQVEASASQDKFEYLLKSVATSFHQSVENAVTISRPYFESGNIAKFDPEAIPARRRFLMCQYKLVSNLVRWRKYAGEKFGVGEMVGRLMNECIRPAAESGWEVGGEDVMQKACLCAHSLLPVLTANSLQLAKVVPPELRQTDIPSSRKV